MHETSLEPRLGRRGKRGGINIEKKGENYRDSRQIYDSKLSNK
ncbi:MAG: hypothetical protein O4805_22280 [Trichodesmium sp. St16_bin2-tuft]|nr:hypothetical protein [Trichodesmium sp. St16_bin2-tuft]MDE5119372.1 hypothetical protein [Trichodesmium sp. St19_bin1]